MSLIDLWIKPYLTQILGAALAASLLGNVAMGLVTRHYATRAISCSVVQQATTDAAKATKGRVENREIKNVQRSERDVRSRISASVARISRAPSRVQDNGGIGDLPITVTGTPGTDGEGGTPVVLPPTVEDNDRRICVTNTIKLEGWQDFYNGQVEIFQEEIAQPNSNRSAGTPP